MLFYIRCGEFEGDKCCTIVDLIIFRRFWRLLLKLIRSSARIQAEKLNVAALANQKVATGTFNEFKNQAAPTSLFFWAPSGFRSTCYKCVGRFFWHQAVKTSRIIERTLNCRATSGSNVGGQRWPIPLAEIGRADRAVGLVGLYGFFFNM